MPYALPPVKELRYQVPQAIDYTWPDKRNATEYGYACMGYGDDTVHAAQVLTSEDCPTLNVVRPTKTPPKALLPVAVFTHGGGYWAGSSRNLQYNLSFIVEQSTLIHQPVIAVSINYSLAILTGNARKQCGKFWTERSTASPSHPFPLEPVSSNVPALTSKSLEWIHENIVHFGGDPERVTIFGESAGAFSIRDLLLAYNGRDDGPFSAAVLESGSMVQFPGMNTTDSSYSRLHVHTSRNRLANTWLLGLYSHSRDCLCKHYSRCWLREPYDKVSCLCQVSVKSLNNAINASQYVNGGGVATRLTWVPIIDKDIVAQDPTIQMIEGKFNKGDTSNEGTSFAVLDLNTDDDLAAALSIGVTTRQKWLRSWSSTPSRGHPWRPQNN
ncbi:unnamed protein product [Clonostachys rosea]|uniref:Carboxylic ester hydrolase n=1 Tax=Bionectria ochroleuca TaxID=29856 RepID=A0ABY6UK40_BIOOC|nr:unnamed protein product [Clonostachys rosea]